MKGVILLTDVEVVGVPNVNTSNANATEVPHGLDALIDNLTGVGLKASSQLDGVRPALGVFTLVTGNQKPKSKSISHSMILSVLEKGRGESMRERK